MTAQEISQGGTNNKLAGRDIVENMAVNLPRISTQPSKIARVIAALSKKISNDIPDGYSAVSYYDIQDKIEYNNVQIYRPIIDRYGYFGATVEAVCSKLDTDKPNSKLRVFEYIKHEYTVQKARVCAGTQSSEDSLEKIRENADSIIDAVSLRLFDIVKDSRDIEDVDAEDINLCLTILVAVAFIDCQILEKPPVRE